MSSFSLASCDLFQGLDDRQEAAVASHGRVRVVPRGAELLRAGAPAEALYVVREGSVRVSVPVTVLGRTRELRLRHAHPGQAVGWPVLVAPHVCSVTARAETSAVLIAFDREALLAVMSADPRVECVIRRNLASVVASCLEHVQALWLREVEDEVAASARSGVP